jgi:phosphomethylpyrimidine synthase
MCGPKFCSMRISQDVRDYAAARKVPVAMAVVEGMREKSAQFRETGASVYVEASRTGEP